MASKSEWLADRLGGKSSGKDWFIAPCPAHDDRRSSLAIGSPGGRLFVQCFAGCSDDAIKQALVRLGYWSLEGGDVTMPAIAVREVIQRHPQFIRPTKSPEERTEAARALWDAALPLDGDDPDNPALLYLQRRGIAAAIGSPALRYKRLRSPAGSMHPALISRVDDVRGRFQGIHAIYLSRNGTKAALDVAKASRGPIRGGAVRIGGMAREIVIGEGVETSIAAGLQLNLPPWAALSSGNLERVVLPEAIRSIVIAADHDAAGIKAAEAAYRRWTGQGRAVRIVKPNAYKADFADVLVSRRAVEIV